jgi:hypothetical protein
MFWHLAVEALVFGLGMIEELAGRAIASVPEPCTRCYGYRATPFGRKVLAAAKSKVRELFHELIEGE